MFPATPAETTPSSLQSSSKLKSFAQLFLVSASPCSTLSQDICCIVSCSISWIISVLPPNCRHKTWVCWVVTWLLWTCEQHRGMSPVSPGKPLQHLVEKLQPSHAWKFPMQVVSTGAAAPFANFDCFTAPLCSTQLLPASTFWLPLAKYSNSNCFEADIFFPKNVSSEVWQGVRVKGSRSQGQAAPNQAPLALFLPNLAADLFATLTEFLVWCMALICLKKLCLCSPQVSLLKVRKTKGQSCISDLIFYSTFFHIPTLIPALATDRQFLLHILPQRCPTWLSLLADTERAAITCPLAWSLLSFVIIFHHGAPSHMCSVASEIAVAFFSFC